MPREIVVQADIGGVTIASTSTLEDGASDTEVNHELDFVLKAIGRQKSKNELSERLLALQVNQRMLDMLPERETTGRKARAAERVRLRESFEAAHNVRNAARTRPSSFVLSKQQQQALDQHDEVTQRQMDGISKERADLERDRPLIEMQISRLRAIIAGRDPNDTPMPQEGAAAAA